MTYYNQLRTLLCEVEDIKKDFKQLGKGVEVYVNKDAGIIGYGNIQCIKDYCEPLGEVSLYGHNEIIKTYNISEVVGNDIGEHHIRMYCGKEIVFIISYNDSMNMFHIHLFNGDKYKSIKYNNSKPFHQQDEEIYRQLVEYFNNIK